MDHEDNQSDYGSDIELDETLLRNLLNASKHLRSIPRAVSSESGKSPASLACHGGVAVDVRPDTESPVSTQHVNIEALLEPSGYETDIELELDFGEPSGRKIPICDTCAASGTIIARYEHGQGTAASVGYVASGFD